MFVQKLHASVALQDGPCLEGVPDFAALPKTVTFTDIEVGKRYTKEVTLTNVSGAPAAFKVSIRDADTELS